MRIYTEESIEDFEAWCGGQDTKEKIIEARKVDEFDELIEELYPNGLTETELNDLLWFEDEWILVQLNIEE